MTENEKLQKTSDEDLLAFLDEFDIFQENSQSNSQAAQGFAQQNEFTLSADDFDTRTLDLGDKQSTEKIDASKAIRTEKRDTKASAAKRYISNIAFIAVIVFMIVGSTLFALSSDPDKSIMGYRFYNVATGSMTPSKYSEEHGFTDGFRAGDMILVKLCEPEDVKKNDIITFVPGKDSKAFLTHRVVDIKTDLYGQPGMYFVTRGDANNTEDPPISADMLIGKKVFSVPFFGGIIKYIRENVILSLVLTVSTFVLLLALRMYFKKPEPNKAPKNIPTLAL